MELGSIVSWAYSNNCKNKQNARIRFIAFSDFHYGKLLAYSELYEKVSSQPMVSIKHFEDTDIIHPEDRAEYGTYAVVVAINTTKTLRNKSVEIFEVKYRPTISDLYKTIDRVHFPVGRYSFGKGSGGTFSLPHITGQEYFVMFIGSADGNRLEMMVNGDEPEHKKIRNMDQGEYQIEMVVTADNLENVRMEWKTGGW
jgi:hypothetical protein